MSKEVKEMVIDELRERVGESRDFLVVSVARVDGVTANRWRLSLRKSGVHVLTVKNNLARQALNSVGISALDPVLEGPSTLVWGGEDVVSLSREITKWAKEIEGLEIKGGAVEGQTLSSGDVDALSKSPGRLELISQIVGLALSPGRQLAAALLGPGGKIAGQLKTISEKEESA